MPSRPALVWSTVLLLGAVALLLLGDVRGNFAPEPSPRLPEDTPLPVLQEPLGELERPPSRFVWTPGGPEVDYAQVLLFDERQERFWESAPLTGGELEVDPATVFSEVPAGPPLTWRVREVADGRPRAISAVGEFRFTTGVDGLGIGETAPEPGSAPR